MFLIRQRADWEIYEGFFCGFYMANRHELRKQLSTGGVEFRGQAGNGPKKVTEAMSSVLKPSKNEVAARQKGCVTRCVNVDLVSFENLPVDEATQEPLRDQADQGRRLTCLIARSCVIFQQAGDKRDGLPCMREIEVYRNFLDME